MLEQILAFMGAILRSSSPLILAALGGLLSERSGVTNIALEGMMLVGAFVGAATSLALHSSWLGFGGAAVAGGVLAALYAFFVIRWKANQIVTATAINILAAGIPPFVCKILYDNTGGTPVLDQGWRFVHNEPVFVTFILVFACWFWFSRTRSGLWVQFAGEHPHALETAGVSVLRVRWIAVVMSGVFAGLGGATLSLFLSSSFTRDMSAGRGFMALAALIMGKWRPIPTAAACLLFGMASALEMRLQGVALWGQPIPVQFIQIMPYVLTILVLAGVVGRSRSPSALSASFD